MNSNIGYASKDLSTLKLTDSEVRNCKYGVVAFEKKKEYGPSKIIVENCKMENIQNPQMIEKNSQLILNGDTINGAEKKLYELFYP